MKIYQNLKREEILEIFHMLTVLELSKPVNISSTKCVWVVQPASPLHHISSLICSSLNNIMNSIFLRLQWGAPCCIYFLWLNFFCPPKRPQQHFVTHHSVSQKQISSLKICWIWTTRRDIQVKFWRECFPKENWHSSRNFISHKGYTSQILKWIYEFKNWALAMANSLTNQARQLVQVFIFLRCFISCN